MAVSLSVLPLSFVWQDFHPFQGWIIFPCIDRPHFASLFIHWWVPLALWWNLDSHPNPCMSGFVSFEASSWFALTSPQDIIFFINPPWRAGEWAGPDLSSCMERSWAVAMRTGKQALAAIWSKGPGQEQPSYAHCPSSFLCPASPSTGPANRKPQARELVPTDQTGFPSRLLFSKLLTSHLNVIYYRVLLFPKWNAYLLHIEFI